MTNTESKTSVKNPRVFIIMLNWNGMHDTIAAVDSVLKNDYSNYFIWLLDNGSAGDDYSELAKHYKGNSKVGVKRSAQNLGFAKGSNMGIAEAIKEKVDYTLLLNNDVEVDSRFLYSLVNTAKKDRSIGIVGSRVFYYHEPKKIWSTGWKMNYYFPPLSSECNPDVEQEVNEVLGCSMLVKNEVFKRIGLLDEKYFAYGEESDFNFRASSAGIRLFYCPSSKVWHKVSASTGGGFNSRVAYLKMRNKIYFARKNLSARYLPTHFVYLFIFFSYWMLKSVFKADWERSSALLRGVADGL